MNLTAGEIYGRKEKITKIEKKHEAEYKDIVVLKRDIIRFAEKLAFIGNLMYEVKGEVKKLSEQFYKEEIFIGLAETKEEIFRFISNTKGKDEIVNVFFNIRDMISKMLANLMTSKNGDNAVLHCYYLTNIFFLFYTLIMHRAIIQK